MLTVLKYTLLVAVVLSGLWLLMVPVYVWILHRDAMLAPQRAAELAEIDALLAETAPTR
ncbi:MULTISPECIES: hypothetical protein [unclassified Acidovorax]|uniref:hypothetical protein n=1 Tax=unclassified Acidovorax TaxID=2684926 RepID=UPI001C489019|nr:MULTISPECIES: hypothetical protein [unclassified Acidovorax]MBV7460461.1 hypothetical protein [Acidovorax sp. sif0632]MBV7465486.1 hypothetical protein [Acidovorax sp. sif0613]